MNELVLLKNGVPSELFSASAPDGEWTPRQWKPSGTTPDTTCFMRKHGDLIEFEVAAGNVSIVPGNMPATKPAHGCGVEVRAAVGYTIVWDLQRPFPTWWPIGRETYRRGVLVPTSGNPIVRLFQKYVTRRSIFAKARSIAEGEFSPGWASRRTRYGPCNMPLPDFTPQYAASLASKDAQHLAKARNGIAKRLPFTIDDSEDGILYYVNGWGPMGPSNPAAGGGSGIYFMRGGRQNLNDHRLARLMAVAEHERMLRYVNRATGEVLAADDYPQHPDLWGDVLPETKGVPNFDPLPQSYDFAHEIRGTGRTIQITEQADSPMARRSLRGVAWLARMRFSEKGRLPIPSYHPLNVNALWVEASNSPHSGFWGKSAGRMIGWAAFELAQDIKVSGSTLGTVAWGTRFLDTMELGATPAGVFQKGYGPPFPSAKTGTGANIYTMQTFEFCILAHGACGLAVQLLLPGKVEPFLRGLGQIYGKNTQVPIMPWYGSAGPWKWLYIADDTRGPYDVLSLGQGEMPQVQGDATHAESAIALALHLTSNPEWRERANLYGARFPNWQTKKGVMMTSATQWQFSLLAQLQRTLP